MRAKTCMGVVLAILTGRAHAEPSDASAVADKLFNEGRELMDANRWAEASSKFEASLHQDNEALGTRLNLARCKQKLGQLGSAWSLYQEVIDLAAKAGDLDRRDYAQKRATELEAQLAKLMILLPNSRPPGFTVAQDGIAVAADLPSVVLYVDAGPHSVTASAPGFEPFTRTVTLAVPARETVMIPPLRPASRKDHDPPGPPPAEGHGVPSPTPATRPIPQPIAQVPQPGVEQPAIDGSLREREAARADAHRLQVKGLELAGIGMSMGLTGGILGWLDGPRRLSSPDYEIFWGAAATLVITGGICLIIGTARDHPAALDVTATPLHGGAAALVTGRW